MIKYILLALLTCSIYAGDGDVVQPEAAGFSTWQSATITLVSNDASFDKDVYVLYDPLTKLCHMQVNWSMNASPGSSSTLEWTSSVTVDETKIFGATSGVIRHSVGDYRTNSEPTAQTGVIYYRTDTNRFVINNTGGTYNTNQFDIGEVFSGKLTFPCEKP